MHLEIAHPISQAQALSSLFKRLQFLTEPRTDYSVHVEGCCVTLIAYEQPSPSGARKTETVASPSALEYALPRCRAVVLLLS